MVVVVVVVRDRQSGENAEIFSLLAFFC
jgi:hypothetical protein